MSLPSPGLADLLELARCLDAGLHARGISLLIKDERGTMLFASGALADALPPAALAELYGRLAADEPRVLAGESIERTHEASGGVHSVRQTALMLRSGARLIIGVIQREALQASSSAELYAAREDERRKLASQMHDSLAQTLTSLSMHAEVLSSVIQHGIEEARVMLHRLRPPELVHAGLEAALRTLLNDARNVEGRVQSERSPEDRLSESQALGLYRMVEGLLEPAAEAQVSEPWQVQIAFGRAGAFELQLEVTVRGSDIALDAARVRSLAEPVEAIGGRLLLVGCAPTHATLRAFVSRMPA